MKWETLYINPGQTQDELLLTWLCPDFSTIDASFINDYPEAQYIHLIFHIYLESAG